MEAPAPSNPAERILSVADRLFYLQGIGATGVNQLIDEAKVAKASFYRHFPGKEDLVVAYLQHRLDAFAAGLQRRIDAQETAADGLLAIFDFIADWLQDTSFRGCAFQNAAAEFPEAKSSPRQVVAKAKAGQRALIAQLCREAGCAENADDIFLLSEGAISQAAITQDLWPVEAARNAVRRLLAS